MGRRLGRSALAATLLVTLLLQAVASYAGPQQNLDRTRNELNRVRNELGAKQARARGVKSEIRFLETVINQLQIVVNKLDAQIERVEAEVREVRAQIKATQAKIAMIEDRATAQAVTLYVSDGSDVLGALLESESLAELDRRAEMLGIAAEENTGALIKYSRLKLDIERQNAQLLAHKRELDTSRDERAATIAQLDRRKTKLHGLYAQLADDIGGLKHREGDLAAEAEAIRNEIIAAQAKRSVASLGESGAGFIWPLNGPVTSPYGMRWGRMHTGIDIDGYTGQPIVASKGGVVILASSYSGYGNAVIIDHGGGISTLYGHMSGFNASRGASVGQGQVIGYVGCTGSCTGDHLHFEVRVNGSPVDPMQYLP